MKSAIKYSISLTLLILIGYVQVFAYVFQAPAVPSSFEESSKISSLASKYHLLNEIFVEEEEEEEGESRVYIKKSVDPVGLVSTFIDGLAYDYHLAAWSYSLYRRDVSIHLFDEDTYLLLREFRI